MKAIGKNIIIRKTKEGTTATKGGLLLAETHREDIRYIEAIVHSIGNEIQGLKKDDVIRYIEAIVHSIGNEIQGLKKDDVILYDRHAGHKIEVDKDMYYVIKGSDVVVVL